MVRSQKRAVVELDEEEDDREGEARSTTLKTFSNAQ